MAVSHRKISIKQEESFSPATGLKFLDGTTKVLHLEHRYVWSGSSITSESNQKYLKSSKMCRWRKMEITRTEVLRIMKEDRNIPHTIKRRKANWIGHILRRNYLTKHVSEDKIEGRNDGKTRNNM
jgi:hypothetical protein